MRIFCVGMNYVKHSIEFNKIAPSTNNEQGEDPVIFVKPSSSLIDNNKMYFLPSFSKDIHYETELVFRICKSGMNVDIDSAMSYLDAITLGLDITARDLQKKLRSQGLPWDISKGFDGSTVVGEWQPMPSDVQNVVFSMIQNGAVKQAGNSRDMIHSVGKIISYISKFYALEEGDLIFTGTPEGVGPILPGDFLEGYIGEQRLFTLNVAR